MTWFPLPSVCEFFDNRLLISWKIAQPSQLPPLLNLRFYISGNPPIKFIPPQKPQIDIPKLNGSDFVINWVIQTPKVRTQITLSLECELFSENQSIIFDPSNYKKILIER